MPYPIQPAGAAARSPRARIARTLTPKYIDVVSEVTGVPFAIAIHLPDFPLTYPLSTPNMATARVGPLSFARANHLALPHHREARWWRNGRRLQGRGH